MEDPRGFRLVGELDASNVGVLQDALSREVEKGGDITLDEFAFHPQQRWLRQFHPHY